MKTRQLTIYLGVPIILNGVKKKCQNDRKITYIQLYDMRISATYLYVIKDIIRVLVYIIAR